MAIATNIPLRFKTGFVVQGHISQCKIAKNLGLSPSTIYNIVKRSKESKEITVLWALRWHCIRNRHAAVLNIATWTQEYFRKPMSFTTVCCCIKKCNLNICYFRRKLYINSMQRCCRVLWARAHLRLSKRQWKCVLYSDESTFQLFLGKWILSSQSPRQKGPFRLSLATEAKANVCHGMGVLQSKQHGWLAYMRRY